MRCVLVAAVVATVAGTTATVSASGASQKALDKAEKTVKKYSKEPTSIGLTQPLSSLPQGKRVYYMAGPEPVAQTIGRFIEEAAPKLGVEVTRVDAGLTPEDIGKAFDRAVAEKPDGVLVTAIPASLYRNQLAELKAADIPVVVWTVNDTPQNTPGITANIAGPRYFKRFGVVMADWIAVEDGGEASDIAYFNVPDFPALQPQEKAFRKELKKVCPKCGYESQNVQAADIATKIPGQIVSYLQRSPDTKWVVLGFGDLGIGVPEAIRAAGLQDQVKIVSDAGGKIGYQYIRDGNVQVMDVGAALPMFGYKSLDALARAMVGDDPAVDDAQLLPIQILTKANINSFDIQQPWPGVADYAEQFEKLWTPKP